MESHSCVTVFFLIIARFLQRWNIIIGFQNRLSLGRRHSFARARTNQPTLSPPLPIHPPEKKPIKSLKCLHEHRRKERIFTLRGTSHLWRDEIEVKLAWPDRDPCNEVSKMVKSDGIWFKSQFQSSTVRLASAAPKRQQTMEEHEFNNALLGVLSYEVKWGDGEGQTY